MQWFDQVIFRICLLHQFGHMITIESQYYVIRLDITMNYAGLMQCLSMFDKFDTDLNYVFDLKAKSNLLIKIPQAEPKLLQENKVLGPISTFVLPFINQLCKARLVLLSQLLQYRHLMPILFAITHNLDDDRHMRIISLKTLIFLIY